MVIKRIKKAARKAVKPKRSLKRKRILYCVCGEGMGHAIRSAVVIKELLKNHEVFVTAPSRAYNYLQKKFENVHNIEYFRIVYKDNKVHETQTLYELFRHFPKRATKNLRTLTKLVATFKPHIILSDFEPFANYVAKVLRIPLVSVDNPQIMTQAKLKIPKRFLPEYISTLGVVRIFTNLPKKYLISTFFYPELKSKRAKLFPPIIREEILKAKPSVGKHILVYQTSDSHHNLIDTLRKITDEKFVVYGFNKKKEYKNVKMREFSEKRFIKELASAKAVICNGGFTLITESLHFRKPILSVPVKKQFEQVLNALYIEELGYGEFHEDIEVDQLKEFLSKVEYYRKNLKKYPKEDNSKIIKEVEHCIRKYSRKYRE